MSEAADPVEFYGVLGRVTTRADRVELRFYPFEGPTSAADESVFVAKLDGPKFSEAEVSALLERELDVIAFRDRIELGEVFEGDTKVLSASMVTAEWAPHDAQDFMRYLSALRDERAKLNQNLVEAVRKDRKGLTLVRELMRRAEIKAAASPDLRVRQAAAIAALERVIRHFEGDAALDR